MITWQFMEWIVYFELQGARPQQEQMSKHYGKVR
jgi:hypothetical protein